MVTPLKYVLENQLKANIYLRCFINYSNFCRLIMKNDENIWEEN